MVLGSIQGALHAHTSVSDPYSYLARQLSGWTAPLHDLDHGPLPSRAPWQASPGIPPPMDAEGGQTLTRLRTGLWLRWPGGRLPGGGATQGFPSAQGKIVSHILPRGTIPLGAIPRAFLAPPQAFLQIGLWSIYVQA